MGEGDFDYRNHVQNTIYWGKGMPDGGKRMGKNEMGTGKHEHARRAWVADDECKGTGKDDMASDVGQGTGKDHSPKSEQLEDAEALQTPRECSRETVECAEEPAQDGDSPRSTHVASCECQFCCPYLHDRLPRKYEAV